MAKELELAKKLAVLGWIFRKRLITEDEYSRTRIHIMSEYDVISCLCLMKCLVEGFHIRIPVFLYDMR